jgi:hypothetical protein
MKHSSCPIEYIVVVIHVIHILIIRCSFSTRKATAHRWLKSMGFKYKEYRKGIYVDGHERDDVVEYRKEFLAKMKEYVFVCKDFVCLFSVLISIILNVQI